jgi:flavorubredoxin
MRDLHGAIRSSVREVLDPAKLAYVIVLYWEGDENGGMDQFMKEAPKSELLGSLLSIQLNAMGFGLADRARGFRDGNTLDLGKHKLRFLETPHVHHWDSMMVVDETTRSLFPSDLFIQAADQPPVVTENLSLPMIDLYRAAGIFAHELPIRQVVDRLEKMNIEWFHPMHGGSFKQAEFATHARALRENEFVYRGMLLGREVAMTAPM